MDRCPTCRAALPPPKTCPGCGETFYRGEGGRTDAGCCSGRCAARIRKRRERERPSIVSDIREAQRRIEDDDDPIYRIGG